MSTSRTSMKCHKCSERAAIRMRHHHIALCKTHYLQWVIDQTERTIKKYHMFTREQRVLLAVSGGKDSLALWDVLNQLGYRTDGLYINLGILGEDEYSDQSEKFAIEFANHHQLKLHLVHVKNTYGAGIPEIAMRTRRGREKPCGVCGLVKRHIMNRVANSGLPESETLAADLGYDVLATAHNLDDEAAVLMGNVMNWHMDLLSRQSPVLDAAPGLIRKVKPFCRFYERETAAYSVLRGIAYIEDECPFAVGSKQLVYKNILNQIEEEQPGAKLAFYSGFLKAKQAGAIQSILQPTSLEDSEEDETQSPRLVPCPGCGQPTTNQGFCAFCRTIAQK